MLFTSTLILHRIKICKKSASHFPSLHYFSTQSDRKKCKFTFVKRRMSFAESVAEELLELFDEKNEQSIRLEKRSIVHREGLLHRTVNVMLFNSKGELLIQKRKDDKDVCPGLWDISVILNFFHYSTLY